MAVNILWMHKRLRISSTYDVTGFTRAVINPVEWNDINTQPQGSTDYTARQFWLENAKEFIDVEGEWYYNKLTGYLYYWPRAAENISTSEIIIPKVQTLFNLSGTFNDPVHHIEISGLEIRHTNWSRPNEYGFVDVQANSLIPSPPNDNTDSQYRHNQKKDRMPAAINTYSASDIRVLRNRFFNLGGTGVTFDAGGKNNDAIGNTFCDLSGGAVEIGNDARNPLDSRMRPVKDSVCNNYITYIGQEYYGACAIIAYYTDSTVISHNEICHMPYGGISIGWGWSDGTAPTPHKPNFNTINHNRINFASEKLFDTGGIYTDNAADNSEIAWNYITNTVLDVGIFNDEMTHDFKIHDNVLEGNHSYNVTDEGWIRINGIQSNNIYTNNSEKGYSPANRTAIIANAGLEEPYKSLIYSNLPALVPTPAPLPSDGGVIDNFDQGYIEYGTWYNSIKPGYNNSLTRYSELVGAAVIWNPSLNAGTYKVSIYRISSGDPNTKIDVVHNGVTSTYTIDYSLPDGWVELGTFEFAAGIDGYVKLTQMTNATNGRADAVKFEKDNSVIPSTDTASNVVFGKTVTVSGTTYSGDPSYLTDGILFDETNTSRWRGDVPSTVDIDFGTVQTIVSAEVYTGYYSGGWEDIVTAFSLQSWNGSSWIDIPGAGITGNTNTHVTFTFSSSVTTPKVRLVTPAGASDFARFLEIQVWKATPYPKESIWTGAISPDWFNVLNWLNVPVDANVPPGPTTDVSIPVVATNYPTITAVATCNNITIASGASLIDENNYLSVSGTANVKRTITDDTDDKWHLFISPVKESTQASAGSCFDGAFVYRYNEKTGAWERFATDDYVTSGQGYAINYLAGSHDLVFTGTLMSSPISYTNLSYSPSALAGWHLVGNPYTCGINPALCSISAGFNAYAYLWNTTSGNYDELSVGSNGFPGTIASLQGFFVRTMGGSNDLTLDNAAKVHGGTFFKSANTASQMLSLSIEGNNYSDKTFVRFNTEATANFDQTYDAYKRAGLDAAPQLYSIIPGEKAAVNTLPDYTSNPNVALGLKVGVSTTYTINVEGIDNLDALVPVRLDDLKLGTSQDMRLNPVYTFAAAPGDIENRFKLSFGSVIGLDKQNTSGINVVSANSFIYVNHNAPASGTVYLYSVSGILLAAKKLNESETSIRLTTTGILMVKVVTDKNIYIRKLVVV
jgi:hypothetical protein